MAKSPSNPFDRYVKADDGIKNRLIWASFGEAGSGKTTFALTAPGPIVIQSLDMGLEGVVEPFTRDKEIYIAEYDWHPTDEMDQDQAIDLRDKFIEDFEHAVLHARTVIWDKETDVWELFRYAEFGKPNDSPKDYAKLYQRYRRYINMPKSSDINFGLLQGMKSPWAMKATGSGAKSLTKSPDRIRKGMDEIDALVHINLQHRREREAGDEGGFKSVFYIDVGKSRGPGSRDVQDQTFQNLTFPEFAVQVFPDTDVEDWR
jgi:hypothetical protein